MSIQHFPPLKVAQFDRIQAQVRDRIYRFLGDQPPNRDDYLAQVPPAPIAPSRRYRLTDHTQPTDWLIPLLFLALLVISMSHILTFAGNIAHQIYHNPPSDFNGIWLDSYTYTVIHQIGFFAFSELGVLFFYTRHCIHRALYKGRIISVSLLVAILCTFVSIYANVNALATAHDAIFGTFVGLLVPLTTLFLGERLAEIVRYAIVERAQALQRYKQQLAQHEQQVQEALKRYEEDFHFWHAVRQNITLFDAQDGVNSYQNYLRDAIVEHYRRSQLGQQHDWTFEDEDNLFKREWSRIHRIKHVVNQETDASPNTKEDLVDEDEDKDSQKSSSDNKKTVKLYNILSHRPDLLQLSGRAIAEKLINEGIYEKISPQYINKVKAQLLTST